MAFQRSQNINHQPIDEGKNPSQQREILPILQVPIRLTNVWCGGINKIMDPLPSKFWLGLVGFKSQEHKMAYLSKTKLSYQTILTLN